MKMILGLIACFLGLMILLSAIPHVKAANVSVLSSSNLTDAVGYYEIFGEVQNGGTGPLEYVKVTATYYNTTGTVIATEYAYTIVSFVLPGTRSPFHITLLESQLTTKIDHYSLTVTYDTSTRQKPAGLQILSYSNYTDVLNYFNIVGEVQNKESQNTTYVEIIVTLYNQTGGVVGCDYTFTDPKDLSPNQTAPFKITFLYSAVTPQIFSYQLTAESQEYSIVPENPNMTLLAMLALIAMAAIVYKRLNGKIKIVS